MKLLSLFFGSLKSTRLPWSYRPRLESLESRTLLSVCTVDRLTDNNPTGGGEGGNGMGDLRYCLTNAGNGDAITFGVTGTINLAGPLPALTHSVNIEGPGPNLLTIRRDTGGDYRIFTVTNYASVNLSGLTITNGIDPSSGGGIWNYTGNLTINDVTISGNAVAPGGWGGAGIFNYCYSTMTVSNSTVSGNSGYGAGILNCSYSTMTVSNSTVSGNTGGNDGAGIENDGTLMLSNSFITGNSGGGGPGIANVGTMTIVRSTVSGNSTGSVGGGIAMDGGWLTIDSSTIANNHSGAAGGGIWLGYAGVATIRNSTITGNSGLYGGGIYMTQGASVTMLNTIVAGNVASYGDPDVDGNPNSQGHNLIGNPQDASGWVDTDLLHVDPLLDPNGLHSNGGPTQTIALQPGSPALDVGDPAQLGVADQRGVVRAGGVNIGAYQASASSFIVTAPPKVTAGTPFDVTVTAVDTFGQLAVGYTGTATFTSSDPQAVLPTDYTFMAGDNGVHTFSNVVLKTAGTQSITATDTGNSSITGTAGIIVNPAAATTFMVSGFPSPVTAGTPGTVTVTAKDAFGNVATGYTGTVHFTSSDPQAMLPANTTLTNGTGTSRATLKTAGTQSITATDTANSALTGTQGSITVIPAAASTLVVAGFPSPQSQGVPGSFTVTAKDPYSNVATGYTGTVHFTSSDPKAMLPANYTFLSGDHGTHTFSASLNTTGLQSLTATDVASGTIQGTQTGITVTGASIIVITFPCSVQPTKLGRPVTLTVTVSAQVAGSGTPTGMVTFYDGTTPLGPPVLLSDGTATFATTALGLGRHELSARYSGDVFFGPSTSVPLLQSITNGIFFAIGGAPGLVQVRRTADGWLLTEFAPFGAAYTGPISVAVGDVNGDGYDDVVVGAGAGNPQVKVYDGRALATGTFNSNNPDTSLLAQWFAYGLNFNVGANVAVGDIEHDGYSDIVTGANVGNPHVKVYRGRDIATGTFDPNGASVVAQWFAYGLSFNVGVNVAAGDVNCDGYADVVTGANVGNPHVKVYNGRDIATGTFNPDGSSVLAQWFAYGLNFNVGAFVAVGDTNGDGYGDVIAGASVGNPHVRVFDGKAIASGVFDGNHPEHSQLDQFFAYGLDFNVGAAVAAADFESTGQFDILTGASAGEPHYRVVRGNATGVTPPALFEGIPADLQGGISVGA
jgi:hypothetical protein